MLFRNKSEELCSLGIFPFIQGQRDNFQSQTEEVFRDKGEVFSAKQISFQSHNGEVFRAEGGSFQGQGGEFSGPKGEVMMAKEFPGPEVRFSGPKWEDVVLFTAYNAYYNDLFGLNAYV